MKDPPAAPLQLKLIALVHLLQVNGFKHRHKKNLAH